jgi:UDP-N-acetyl-D-glucosamine/UDP-N-acetyl-D-galactosamine dehydrogenase
MSEKIAVIGLGYVGLPLLVALAEEFDDVIGFDIDRRRIETVRVGTDWTGEIEGEKLKNSRAILTHNPDDLTQCSFFIATVPTPIDQEKKPDLRPILSACKIIGDVLRHRKKQSEMITPVVVFESTVYPGLTEDICGAEIAKHSGLKQGQEFRLGYSPERINPGDKNNRLENIVKIIAAEDNETLERMTRTYGAVVKAGLYRAPSIRVAEAAKVLENTQRDLNVALMNELAIICDKCNIRTQDVLDAAGTKWNFLKFTPGLVGGHCIGVDPYYLTHRAEELGYHPQVILAGRRINDGMAGFIAQKIITLISNGAERRQKPRVGILGLTFKENVRDIRNSRVPEIVRALEASGVKVIIHDPLGDHVYAEHDYGLLLQSREALKDLDALVLAVPHKVLVDTIDELWPTIRSDGYLIDIKSVINSSTLPKHIRYWSL